MATPQIVYPNNVNFVTAPFCRLYNAKNPIYTIFSAKKSTIINYNFAIINYLTINFQFIVQNVDYKKLVFNFNGEDYTNTTSITGKNQFLITGDPLTLYNSLYSMFSLNGILEEFDLIDTNYNSSTNTYSFFTAGRNDYKVANYILNAKNNGALEKFTTTMPTVNAGYSDNFSTSYGVIATSGGSSSYNTILQVHKYPLGDNISQDVDRYELGVDVYKIGDSYTGLLTPSSNRIVLEKVATLSKKGLGVGDFDLSSIVSNNIADWKPIINDFNINNVKWIEQYQVKPWQKYLDVSINPNNTFVNKIYDQTDGVGLINTFYAIDGYEPLFDNYTPPDINILNQEIPNPLDEDNQGTYGNVSPNTDYNKLVYDRNLTNQPKFKKINRGYEILCNQMSSYNLQENQQLHDKVYFNFIYNDTSNEIISINNYTAKQLNGYKGGSFRYINQLCFNVKNLKTKITGDWNNLNRIDVHFYNPEYTYPVQFFAVGKLGAVNYETQTYYIDQTIQDCDDDTFDEIDYLSICWKNARGGFDIFEFDSINSLKTSRNYDSFLAPYTYQNNAQSDFQKVYNIDFQKIFTAKTRILTNEEFVWLEEIIKAKKVYVLNPNDKQLYPIVIQSSDYGFTSTTADKQISITFNYSRPDVTA